MRILSIDPGNTESGWCVIDTETYRPIRFAKTDNDNLYAGIFSAFTDAAPVPDFDHAVVEMIASYGMAVGAEVFETCVWIGRFYEAIIRRCGHEPQLIKRHPVKLHHCHSAKAKDSNITQALVDRFAHGRPNHGKGTKADPGWFYGFKADVWQAYALAVYAADTRQEAA